MNADEHRLKNFFVFNICIDVHGSTYVQGWTVFRKEPGRWCDNVVDAWMRRSDHLRSSVDNCFKSFVCICGKIL